MSYETKNIFSHNSVLITKFSELFKEINLPVYFYKARDNGGKLVKGTLEAVDKTELAAKLHRMGYLTTQAKEALPGVKIETFFDRFRRISSDEIVMFYIQFADMLNAGINILTALNTLYKQAENKRLKEIIADIARSIEAGDILSEALAKHPRVFSKLFISMIKAGEASGKLDNVLRKFAEFAEEQSNLRQKIKGALFYPFILFTASVSVILFIVTFIIPQFAEIFIANGIKLPLVTLILYAVGMTIRHFWHFIFFVLIIFYLAARFYSETERGRLKIDEAKLKLPVFGSLLRKAAISRFSRTLATLVSSGVPILQSLDIVREVAGNEVLAKIVAGVRASVEKGGRIAETLKVSKEFPQDTVQMISVGEESGDLDGMLNKIADFYDRAVDYNIKKLSSILEPVFLVIMGCIVGFIMASMLLPIFDMIRILKH